MDPITQQTALASAGGKKDPVYVDDVFQTVVWDGTGSSQTIPNNLNLLSDEGIIITKVRDAYDNWNLTDPFNLSASGTYYGRLVPNDTHQEYNQSFGWSAVADKSLTLGGNDNQFNQSGRDYLTYLFKKQEHFFDTVKWTGNGVNGRQIPHSLGSKPGMIWVKRIDTTIDWYVYHNNITASNYLVLNQTWPSASGNVWYNTEPTSTHFTVNNGSATNDANGTYVAYLFGNDEMVFGTDENEPIIKCGVYTGNGNQNNYRQIGFEPQWVMVKPLTNTSINNFQIYDDKRGTFSKNFSGNTNSNALLIDSPLAEQGYTFEFFANGFRPLDSHNNNSGVQYMYVAIRRPHKPPEVGTDVFAVGTKNQNSAYPSAYTALFAPDLAIDRPTINNTGIYNRVIARLTGKEYVPTNGTNPTATDGSYTWDYMNGFSNDGTIQSNSYAWMFKRAPGFNDVVMYDGSGSVAAQNHNLTVPPELTLVKERSGNGDWYVWHKDLNSDQYLLLNGGHAALQNQYVFTTTAPTSTQFYLGGVSGLNGSTKSYTAILFATLPGISKVGSYTGNSSYQTIDCGFTTGARFILIKRTNGSGGSWYLFDHLRGIVLGDDPYLLLEANAPQTTNTNLIDTNSSGFALHSSTQLNDNGDTYIFLAIA